MVHWSPFVMSFKKKYPWIQLAGHAGREHHRGHPDPFAAQPQVWELGKGRVVERVWFSQAKGLFWPELLLTAA